MDNEDIAEEMYVKYLKPQVNSDGYIYQKNAWIAVKQIVEHIFYKPKHHKDPMDEYMGFPPGD